MKSIAATPKLFTVTVYNIENPRHNYSIQEIAFNDAEIRDVIKKRNPNLRIVNIHEVVRKS